jgi:hypothetical protein
MIVWLASYPRSGNTLLRTILHQTMGLTSLPERAEWPRLLETKPHAKDSEQVYGEVHPEMPWEEFYPRATASEQVHLVKTHEGPMDGQPAIYVVRDGRKAIYSYLKYHRSQLPKLERTLMELVTGHDFYGDWSSHYRAWNEGSAGAPRMLVKYEDLLMATPALVSRLAAFVGHPAEPRPWVNPFPLLHRQEPEVFREGTSEWVCPEDWGTEVEWLFSVFHGPLMASLNYESCTGDGFADTYWEGWRERTAGAAMDLLDDSEAMDQTIRRANAETTLLRARLLT